MQTYLSKSALFLNLKDGDSLKLVYIIWVMTLIKIVKSEAIIPKFTSISTIKIKSISHISFFLRWKERGEEGLIL